VALKDSNTQLVCPTNHYHSQLRHTCGSLSGFFLLSVKALEVHTHFPRNVSLVAVRCGPGNAPGPPIMQRSRAAWDALGALTSLIQSDASISKPVGKITLPKRPQHDWKTRRMTRIRDICIQVCSVMFASNLVLATGNWSRTQKRYTAVSSTYSRYVVRRFRPA